MTMRSNLDEILEIITNGMTETYTVDRKTRMHGSEAGYCHRLCVFNGLVVGDNTTTATSRLYMKIGNAIHEAVTAAADKQKTLLYREYKLPDIGLNLGGYVDAIVYLPNTKKLALLEIKSCGALPGDIKDGHREQALFYHAVTGITPYVVYVSRNVSDFAGRVMIKPMKLNYTDDNVFEAVYSAAYAYYSMKLNVVGDIPFGMNTVKCKYCAYKTVCFGNSKIPKPLRLATLEESTEIMNDALAFTKAFLDADERKRRTHGIIKHLQAYGTEHAQSLLSSSIDWDSII